MPHVVLLALFFAWLGALKWGLLFFATLLPYFTTTLTLQKGLLLAALQVFVLLPMIALNIWFVWASRRRLAPAWYVHIAICVFAILWLLGAYLWFNKPLLRLNTLSTYVEILTLVVWFSGEVKAWYCVDKRTATAGA
jgi:hypothetical protein